MSTNWTLQIPRLNMNMTSGSMMNIGNYTNFGNFGGFNNFGGNMWNTTTTSSSATTKVESYEEYIARKNKEAEKKEAEYKRLQDEIKQYKASIEEQEKFLEETKNDVVDEQGVLVKKAPTDIKEYRDKQPWLKRTLRAAGNMVQGVWKLATDFVGYEKDPETGKSKINPKKCIRNLGIAAGCMALTFIPVVGPWITFGLLATGVVTGVAGVGKGIAKACKAETTDDIDKAFQEIGSGAFIGISSAVGLKGLGKSLSVSHTTGSVSRSVGKNAFSQFFKDMTVNAFKATKQTSAAQRAACAQNGFWKTLGDNLPKFGKKKFERELKRSNEEIDARIKDIDARLHEKGVTRVEKDALKFEREALQGLKKQQTTIKTQAEWENFGRENDAKFGKELLDSYKEGDLFKYNTQRKGLKLTDENIHFLDEAMMNLDNFSSGAANLAKTRHSTMKLMSFDKRNARDFRSYTGSKATSGVGRFWSMVKPAKGRTVFGTVFNYIKSGAGMIFNTFMGITFKPWNMLKNSPATTWFKFETTFLTPTYEESMIKGLLGMGDVQRTIPDENGQAQVVTGEAREQVQLAVNEVKAKIKADEDAQKALYEEA